MVVILHLSSGKSTFSILSSGRWSNRAYGYLSFLIVPNGIHSEALLRNVHASHARKILITESVHFHKTYLIIADGQPLVAKIARAYGVGVTAAGRGGMDKELALDVTVRPELESSDVASDIKVVAASSRKEIFAAASGESDIATVLVAGRES